MYKYKQNLFNGDWGLGPIPNPQLEYHLNIFKKIMNLINILIIIKIIYKYFYKKV